MKIKKFFLKIIIIFSILQLLIYPVYSLPVVKAVDWGEVITSSDDWLQKGRQTVTGEQSASQDKYSPVYQSDIKKASDTIFNTLLIAAVVISVIVGGILGIQFMLASVEDKAKIKEALVPYVLGCVVAFGAIGIWGIFVKLLNQ